VTVALPIFRRIREIFESIAYAGLQPGVRPGQTKRMRWLGPLSGPVDRLLSGGSAPSDPLYLTNRTTGQKVKAIALIGIPILAVGYVVYGMLTNRFDFGEPPPPHETTRAEMAAKLLPPMDPNLRVETDKDVEITECRVELGAQNSLVGSMRNKTDHEIRIAEAVFDLTDGWGSQLGGVSARIENLKARSTATFRVPIEQARATFALVRTIHTQ
jgi:hypothetical protein